MWYHYFFLLLSVFACKVVDGSPCYWILCVVGLVSQGYMLTGWRGCLSSLAFFVRQVLEVAREVYSCVVEAGVWLLLVLDSDYADAVFVYINSSVVVFYGRYSDFGVIGAAFVFLVFVGELVVPRLVVWAFQSPFRFTIINELSPSVKVFEAS